MEASEFWKRFDFVANSKGLNLFDISQRTNISYNTIRQWRSQNRFPRLPDAYKMSLEIGVSLEYLLGGEKVKLSQEAYFVESNQEMRTLVRYCMNDHQLLPALKIIMGQSHPGKRQ